MEDRQIEFSKAEIENILKEEFADFTDWLFPMFFLHEVDKYFLKQNLFDMDKSWCDIAPYVRTGNEQQVLDKPDTVDVELKRVELENIPDIPEDEPMYWITSYHFEHKGKPLLPLDEEYLMPKELKEKFVNILLGSAMDIMPNSDKPELDLMFNILADIGHYDCPKNNPDDDEENEDFCY